MKVQFYDKAEDALLKFAVIFAQIDRKWIFCKHKERDTYETPGGHREPGETIIEAAKRELFEETGALKYELKPICIYSVTSRNSETEDETETFGMLYHATIDQLGDLPKSEIEAIIIQEELPERWTYPLIQPVLIEKVQEFLRI